MFAWFERWFPKRWWVCNDNGLYVTKAWCAPPECTFASYLHGGHDTEDEAVELSNSLDAGVVTSSISKEAIGD